MRKRRSAAGVIFALFGFALLAAGPARAELRIEITKGVSGAVPIAVVPFGWRVDGVSPGDDVAAIVATDLARSGRFEPMPRSQMLETPTTGAEVDFQDWRLLNAQILVIGQITPAGPDSVSIQFQVFDIFRGDQILGYRMNAPVERLRGASHRIADMIFEKLTGISGAFATRIAYITVDREGDGQRYRLIVADSDGENPNVIADSADPIMSPAWSPDGRKLAYVSFEGGRSQVYVQVLRTGFRESVSNRLGVNGAPAWHPSGKSLALTLSERDGNLDIYTLDLGSGRLQRVTRHSAIDTEPEWTPDGQDILFTSDRAGGPQIYRVPGSGGDVERITFEGNYNARARISPDGKRVAVVHNDRGNYRIAVVDLIRRSAQVLSEGRLDEAPSFAPNGAALIYASRRDGSGLLETVSVDGLVRGRISSPGSDVREPVWSPYPPN